MLSGSLSLSRLLEEACALRLHVCEEYDKNIKPLRKAMADDRLGKNLGNKLEMESKGAQKNYAVISKNTQYTAKDHALKFQLKHGERQEFTVISKSGGLVEREEIGTGVRSTRHEGSLKLLPKVHPAAEDYDHENLDQDFPRESFGKHTYFPHSLNIGSLFSTHYVI